MSATIALRPRCTVSACPVRTNVQISTLHGHGGLLKGVAGPGVQPHAKQDRSFRQCQPVLNARLLHCGPLCCTVVTSETSQLLPSISKELPPSQASGQQSSAGYGAPMVGSSADLGATYMAQQGITNFAVFSSAATAVSLVLYTKNDLQAGSPTYEIELDRQQNRTGDIWHIALPRLDASLLYGYRLHGPCEHTSDAVAWAKGAENNASPEEDGVVISPGQRFNPAAVVLDPYAKAIMSRRHFGELGPDVKLGEAAKAAGVSRMWPQSAGILPVNNTFDWQGDQPLRLPKEDLVIYEMHVRGFSRASSTSRSPGTYAGVTENLEYLKSLGINAIELLPVHEFNELEYYAPMADGQYRYNFWGYSTVNFFSPMARYSKAASDGGNGQAVINEFKTMVREAHKAGIEVILDVVFNHTAEGNENGPTISFRGLDNRVYYMLAPQGQYYNFSGCGNTLNCNHPVVQSMIIAALRYWVSELHVDGFRFDLGSIMTRAHSLWQQGAPEAPPPSSEDAESSLTDGSTAEIKKPSWPDVSKPDQPGWMENGAGVATGTPLPRPSLIEAISEDPLLSSCKLIAEAWDCGPLMQVGAFPHYGGRWAEWNGRFRDSVRTFIKGTEGPWATAFANAMSGSPDVYSASQAPEDDWWGNNGGAEWRGGREPQHSINFITAHDGFPLADLVSFTEKHNEANGEDNRDGESHNLTWNCGEEGESHDRRVLALRARQTRNLAAALLLAHGVPMFAMGDEYGHSKGGNNNTYCHDSPLNWLDWKAATDKNNGFARFFRNLVALRRRRKEFRAATYSQGGIQWHGVHVGQPDFSEHSRLVAWSLGSPDGGMYMAFNSSHRPVVVDLPDWAGRRWQLVADSGKKAPYDFLVEDAALSPSDAAAARRDASVWIEAGSYPLLPYSCVILESFTEEQLEQQAASSPRATSKLF